MRIILTSSLCLLVACSQVSESNLKEKLETVEISYPVIPVLIENENNVLAEIHIKPGSGIKLGGISLNLDGTDNLKDLDEIKVFYTGSSPEFTDSLQIGSMNSPSGQMSVKTGQDLIQGNHYFWITAKLNSSTNIRHKIKCIVESIKIDNHEIGIEQQSNHALKRIGHALRKHDDDGVDTYRIPGLTTTNKGTLIAVYDIRYDNSGDLQNNIDIGMSRSMDSGQTWEPMKVIMDKDSWGSYGDDGNGIGDPCILVDRETNTIWVAALWAYGKVGERMWSASGPGMKPSETGQLLLVKSDDDGTTWSGLINITEQLKNPEWHLFFQGPGKGITMRDGTLVFPAQFKDKNDIPHSTLIYSKDHGKNWHIGTGVRENTTEAQLVELEDGRIMINCRNDEARNKKGIGRVVAVTDDLGKTWKMHPSSIVDLEESTCMASLIYDSFTEYGKILLFSNPNTYKGRYDITIKASTDEGMTWPEKYWLLLDEKKGNGYSCMTKIDDNNIGILYEGSQADLVFQIIPVADILE